jgi:hypothetical protein
MSRARYHDGVTVSHAEPSPVDRPRYSVTELMVYEACPHQYYATYVEGRPPPVTPQMRRGANVHAQIARILRQPSLFVPEVGPELQPLLDTFLRSRFNVPPIAVERPFIYAFEGGDVHGRIDVMIPRGESGLELVDFKSGSTRPRADVEGSLQLPLYSLAASREHDVSPEDMAYTYFYLSDGGEVTFHPDTSTFERVADRVEGILENIHLGLFEPRPGCRCHACRGEFGRPRRDRRA